MINQTEILFQKSQQSLSDDELFGINCLARAGYHVVVRKENPLAAANIDLLVNGNLWELKNISNNNSSISNQIKRARIKWLKLNLGNPVRIVFTMNNSNNTVDEMCIGLESRKRDGEEIILITKEGEILAI